MAKNFRTPCDDVQDLLASKGINVIPTEKWVVGQTYFTLGLDNWCYPCVSHIKYLGTKDGKYLFEDDGLRCIVEDMDLYDITFTNLSAISNACKIVKGKC